MTLTSTYAPVTSGLANRTTHQNSLINVGRPIYASLIYPLRSYTSLHVTAPPSTLNDPPPRSVQLTWVPNPAGLHEKYFHNRPKTPAGIPKVLKYRHLDSAVFTG